MAEWGSGSDPQIFLLMHHDHHPQIFLLMHHDHHHYDLQQKYTQLLEIVVAFGCERFNAAYFTI